MLAQQNSSLQAIYTLLKKEQACAQMFSTCLCGTHSWIGLVHSRPFQKGFFYGAPHRQLEQYLYWVIFAVIFAIWLLRGRKDTSVLFISKTSENWQRWLAVLSGVLIFIAIMALVSINSHSGLSGAQERF